MRALLFVALLAGCTHHQPPAVVPHVNVQIRQCLALAPPPAVKFAVYRAPACALPFEACLLPADAQTLGDQLEDLTRWAKEAWTRCGPAPTPAHPP